MKAYLKNIKVILAVSLAASLVACADDNDLSEAGKSKNFNRIASFAVCSQIENNCNTDTETSAEIVAASEDGNTLIYTDSSNKSIGFIDITDPANPVKAGTISIGHEPTSVAIFGDHALVGINTSADFINPTGKLDIYSVSDKSLTHSIDMGGQPDAVAISKDGQYAAIVIENERDEDLGDGRPAQAPAGYLVIVKMNGQPATWTTQTIGFTSLTNMKFSTDPEPEYVDINEDNIAVVTFQENNHIAIVNLVDGSIQADFSAGVVDLANINTIEEKSLISLNRSLNSVPREPDGVTWISTDLFATADEGDLDGGSRGFTIFNKNGDVVYTSGNTMEHQTVRLGHYPDKRSGNKGNEPENADYGVFGDHKYLFVVSERANLVFVYDVADTANPILKQVLPAGVGPEGVLAIPSRNLLVVASEKDDRGDKFRSAVNIYSYQEKDVIYPTIESANDSNNIPIAWGALSGLAADVNAENTVYAIEDSFYKQSRIFKLNTSTKPAVIEQAIQLKDTSGVLAALPTVPVDAALEATDAARIDVFDSADLTAMINADQTVNLDPEGIAVVTDGGFWIASEGNGTVGDSKKPVNSPNLIVKVTAQGDITQAITLPASVNANQLRFGFEGVAEYNGKLYLAQQRAWAADANPVIRIYDIASESWTAVFYPLETPGSQNAGWVGLSDIASLGDGTFLVIERDNQGGPDASIKRLYKIDLNSAVDGSTISKTLLRDLMPDLKVPGGLVYEKIEGLAVMANGDVLIVNDNDGVDDNNGETQLINLGKIL